MYGNLLLLSIFLPIIGGCFSLLTKYREAQIISTVSVFISLIFSVLLLKPALNGELIELNIIGGDFLAIHFVADTLSVVFALVFSLISFVSLFYAYTYFTDREEHVHEFNFMSTLMSGALIGSAYSQNLLMFFVFWEIVAFTTWRLVGYYRKEDDIRIADKTLLIMFIGSSLMLLGFLMVYNKAGTLDIDKLTLVSAEEYKAALILIFFGLIAKSATLPLHIWLADAHPVAPSPMSAILSGIVVKIGLIAYIKVFIYAFNNVTFTWMLYLVLISSIIAGGSAYLEKDIKRIIAYSTVSQLGFILAGFMSGTRIGIIGALLYFITHSLAKAGLFLGAGVVEKNTGLRNIEKLGGLIKEMPFTATGFLLCGLSIMGIAPLGGFFAKFLVLAGLIKGDHILPAILAIISSVLTMLYIFRLFNGVFIKKAHEDTMCLKAKEKSVTMVASVVFLGIGSLLIGLFIKFVYNLPEMAFSFLH